MVAEQPDDDWDAVGEAETSRDSSGWYAEIRIPFSAIRYRSAPDMTWGINVWRYMHGRGQDTAWKTWSRDLSGFVSRLGNVSGIRGIHAPRQLEVLPYVLQRATDPALVNSTDQVDNWDSFANVGLDMKYGMTSDLTLNATIQPDFGQVEDDPATLNLSPFETFYQEKRPFFIEGSRFFQMSNFYVDVLRRLGLSGEPELEELLSLFARGVHVHFTAKTPKLEVVRADPEDDKFIECAVALKAAFIVTGDRALQEVGNYMGIGILSPGGFLKRRPSE